MIGEEEARLRLGILAASASHGGSAPSGGGRGGGGGASAAAPAPLPASGKAGKKKKSNKSNGDGKGKTAASTIAAPAVSADEVERRFKVIHSVGEECVSEGDLRNLLTKKANFRLYDGFEPSGRMHIAQGVFKALNVNKCTSAGGTFCFWVADWFGLMNDKMGGDLDKIKVVGQYFIEVWKGTGMDLSNVEFRWASDDIINNAEAYWDQMLDITRRFTLGRIKKCCQIMGRLEGNLTAAQVLYPLMQCSDVFFLKTDICQLGVDQRKVNMLAREYCDFAGRKLKPVILSHHMLYGLAEGQAKMSKSNPDSAIFMEDSASEVERKMSIAYCPKVAASNGTHDDSMSLVVDDLKNPCLDYVEHIVMTQPNAVFRAGDGSEYASAEACKAAFLSGALSEADLKSGLTREINKLLEPVRQHFANDAHAKDVLAKVTQYKREAAAPPKRLKRAILPDVSDGLGGKCVAVFAPRPSHENWNSLSAVLGTRAALQTAKRVASDKGLAAGAVLYLPDLNAVSDNCFGSDKKRPPKACIRAAFELFVSALRALSALEGVTVLRQSDIMEAETSNYWMSVINVGRRFQLDKVHKAIGTEKEKVGSVVAALMHCGDVQALAPHTLVAVEGSAEVGLNELAAEYLGLCQDQEACIAVPNCISVPEASAVTTSAAAIAAHEESKTNNASIAVEFKINEKWKPAANKKFKQAFCEPDNAQDSPVLNIADAFSLSPFQVKTADGPKTYDNVLALRQDCAVPGRVHPADLKGAVAPLLEKAFKAFEMAYAAPENKKARDLVEKYNPK